MTTLPSERGERSLWPKTVTREIEVAARAVGKDPEPLDKLYRRYEVPLRVHLRGTFHSYPAVLRNWEDLLAEFTQKRILNDGWLKYWRPERGRFRDFLRTSLTNFIRDWLKKQPEFKAEGVHRKELWKEHQYFAALGPVNGNYEIIVLDRVGSSVADFRFADSAEGWNEFDRNMRPFRRCPLAIRAWASAPEQLLKRDHPLYQPLQEGGDEQLPGASKKDRGLLALAQVFRTDGHQWWALRLFEDMPVGPPPPPPPPPNGSELDLARVILAQAINRLEKDCKGSKREQPRYGQVWEIFRLRILDPILDGAKAPRYEKLVKELSIPSPNEATFMLYTAKRLFRQHLADVVAEMKEAGEATTTQLAVVTRFIDNWVEKKAEKKAKKK